MHYLKIVKSFSVLFLVLIPVLANSMSSPIANHAQAAYTSARPVPGGPTLNDPNLKVEQIFTRLQQPTSMAFLGPNDILVLEKNTGTVQRIVNGKMLPQPVLDVNVANLNERGMLGIAIAKHNGNGSPIYVFLYYTEIKVKGSDICPKPNYCEPGHDPLGNRLYRYELINNNKLVNPKLLLLNN